jgi:hypothetical protein
LPGQKVRCPRCQAGFLVPDPDDAAPAVPAGGIPPRPPETGVRPELAPDRPGWEDEGADGGAAGRPARRRLRKKKKARGNPALLGGLIGGGAALLLSLGILVLVLVVNQGQDEPARKGLGRSSPGGWEPAKALLEDLGPETAVGPYRLRPPRTYSLVKQGGVGKIPLTGWAGPRRPDGTAPILFVAVAPVAPGERDLSLEQFLQKFLEGLRTQFEDADIVQTERGRLGGLDFIRTRVQGVVPKVRKRGFGFIYLARDGDTGVVLFYLDVAHRFHETVGLVETSALTFRKP